MREVFYSIGNPGRAALELPDGAPGSRSGPADLELSAAALPGILIRAATTRGLLHRRHGTSRQDAFALSRRAAPGMNGEASVVAVVCDGVGQFGRSDEAAVLVSRCLADLGADGVPWPEAFASANDQLRKAADEVLATEDSDAIGDGMATTAVAVAVHREAGKWAGSAAWIGDSTVWHLSADRKWALLTTTSEEEPEDFYHSSAVRPMPSADGACSHREFQLDGGALFVMSDGVSNPLKWSSEVQEVLADWWMRPPDAITFAAQVGFARKAHVDDRTVIGIWPAGGDADDDDCQQG
ncbi:MAG TPA: protein phosphatase 2C domain-containing protein [Streptosporangiaceae bacterium]|nr:protein phosphatase 2C domain-containing protein [Streptosporangiaceae bacterium]